MTEVARSDLHRVVSSLPTTDCQSRPLPMNPGTEVSAEILDLGERFVVGAADGKDHALASLKLVGRCDPQAIVGDPHRSEKLDGEVPLGRVEEESDDPVLAFRALDDSGPDLRHFHGERLSRRVEAGWKTGWSVGLRAAMVSSQV
jgi:hypothetical protein